MPTFLAQMTIAANFRLRSEGSSISHLMHSTSTFPTERIIPLDFKYSQTLSVDERGDGFIRVISAGDGEPSGDGAPVAIQGIEHSDAEKLLK